MSTPMTSDEIVRSLVAMGVPKPVALQQVGKLATPPANVLSVQIVGEPLAFPIRFVVPWSALISENRRFAAVESRIRETTAYRAAKQAIQAIAQRAMTASDGVRFDPLARPLALLARVYVPDNRVHDVPNFAGATHNALKAVVYTDDRWLYDARWLRAGVDQDHPRAEIEVTPL